MKKLMFTYLNAAYPNSYCVKTSWGNVPHFGNVNCDYAILSIKSKIVSTLSHLFCCSPEFADEVYSSWIKSFPVYIRVKTLVNSSVLVLEQTGSNCSIMNSV